MRKFTKEHNEIDWLFPQITKYHKSEKVFNKMESRAEYLLNSGYDEQEVFTRDDMIDAFMKGASEMNQEISCYIEREKEVTKQWGNINFLSGTTGYLKEDLETLYEYKEDETI